ncbi:head-tail connector protein [uncultured Oscillibacter sp.]|uniref:head-tail connector protein n=1 Tax=uncultured Oscillibacter sp. TaxID=876091 RepID=UPI00263182A9|nr:head-tail connector protein [uncultured Oscillibacter sp.]
MALDAIRETTLKAYCRVDELSAEEEELFSALYNAAVGYMVQAGVREPPEYTPRRAQFDLCVNYLVLDSWDRRDVSFMGTSAAENPSFRRLLNQLKLTEPDVSNLDTSGSGEDEAE